VIFTSPVLCWHPAAVRSCSRGEKRGRRTGQRASDPFPKPTTCRTAGTRGQGLAPERTKKGERKRKEKKGDRFPARARPSPASHPSRPSTSTLRRGSGSSEKGKEKERKKRKRREGKKKRPRHPSRRVGAKRHSARRFLSHRSGAATEQGEKGGERGGGEERERCCTLG